MTEACFLLGRAQPDGPAKVTELARRGVFEIAIKAEDHWANIETLLTKYAEQPMSFADACLVRCAEIWDEPRILTFDEDFRVYRWGRNKKFHVL